MCLHLMDAWLRSRSQKAEARDGAAGVYETATGKKLPDVVPRVRYATAGGSIEWNRDASGFYYTRYPQGNERPPEDMNFYHRSTFINSAPPPVMMPTSSGKSFPA